MVFKPEPKPIPEITRRVKKARFTKKDRVILACIFVVTLLLSLGVLVWTKWPAFWQKATSPLVISTLKPEKKFDATSIISEIEKTIAGKRGEWGIWVYRLSDNHEYGLRQSEVFPSASLIKLPVIISLYQEAERGQFSLETEYKLQDRDKVGGAGILQTKKAGTVYTYRQLAENMAHYSDNTAFNIVVRALGKAKIQANLNNWGLVETSLEKYETTPADVGRLFQKLYQGELVKTAAKEEILQYLTKTVYEDWMPAGVPADIQVAHKIGRDLGTFADAGIIFAEKPFVLVIMSKEAKESEAVKLLPEITQKVWEWEKVNSGW